MTTHNPLVLDAPFGLTDYLVLKCMIDRITEEEKEVHCQCVAVECIHKEKVHERNNPAGS